MADVNVVMGQYGLRYDQEGHNEIWSRSGDVAGGRGVGDAVGCEPLLPCRKVILWQDWTVGGVERP